jgi:hypothetical protein
MTETHIELTEDTFDEQYPLLTNHLNPNASWGYGESGGCLFETYGEEIRFVKEQHPRTIWTIIDGDDGDLYVVSGYHFVNRVGYLISINPVPEDVFIEVRTPMAADDEA